MNYQAKIESDSLRDFLLLLLAGALAFSMTGCGTIQKAGEKAEAIDKNGQAQVEKIPDGTQEKGSAKPGVGVVRAAPTGQVKTEKTRARAFETVAIPGCDILDARIVDSAQGLVVFAQVRCNSRVTLERLDQLASRDAYRFGNRRTVSACAARADVLNVEVASADRFLYTCSEGDRVSARLVDLNKEVNLGSLPELRPVSVTKNFAVVSADVFETDGVRVLSTNRLPVEPKAVTERQERLTLLSDARCDTLAGGTLERGSFQVFDPSSERDLFSLGEVSVGYSVNHLSFRVFDLSGCTASGLSARLAPTKRPDAILGHSESHVLYRSGSELVVVALSGEELTLGEAVSGGLVNSQPYAVAGGTIRLYQ